MLKRLPANENYQMLPYYEVEYKPKQNTIDFESAKEVLMEIDEKWLKNDDLRGYIKQ